MLVVVLIVPALLPSWAQQVVFDAFGGLIISMSIIAPVFAFANLSRGVHNRATLLPTKSLLVDCSNLLIGAFPPEFTASSHHVNGHKTC
jgi:hypothetical protein